MKRQYEVKQIQKKELGLLCFQDERWFKDSYSFCVCLGNVYKMFIKISPVCLRQAVTIIARKKQEIFWFSFDKFLFCRRYFDN